MYTAIMISTIGCTRAHYVILCRPSRVIVNSVMVKPGSMILIGIDGTNMPQFGYVEELFVDSVQTVYAGKYEGKLKSMHLH